MKIDDLNKSQIVLLTLLVSFVTSIATGIVTVTLLDQAPRGVTQTINKVVERTIERVVPGETKISTVVKEVPVIVTEEQLVVEVINKTSPAVAALIQSELQNGVPVYAGTGFFVGKDGWFLTRGAFVESGKNYAILTEKGQIIETELIKSEVPNGLALFRGKLDRVKALSASAGNQSLSEPLKEIPFLTFAEDDAVVGQTVIAIGVGDSPGNSTVAVSIVSSLTHDPEIGARVIKTNAVTPSTTGGPLLNIKGDVVGMNMLGGSAVLGKIAKGFFDSNKK
jgi:S1-C subfamily serine protease